MNIDNSFIFDNIRKLYSKFSFNCKNGSVKKPIRYFLDVTYRCNLQCPFCYLGTDERQLNNELSAQDWINVIKQIPKFSNISIIGGEPLIKKGFKDIYHAASDHSPWVNIYSNALLLNEEWINDFIKRKLLCFSFSLDGWKEIHDKNRNKQGAFDTVINNVDMMISKMKGNHKIIIDLKSILLDNNIEDLLKLYEYCTKKEIDFFSITILRNNQLRQHPCLRETFTEEFYKTKYPVNLYFDLDKFEGVYKEILKMSKYSKTKIRWAPKFQPKNAIAQLKYFFNHGDADVTDLYEPCVIPFCNFFINPEGNVYPCLSYKIGSVKEQQIMDIINSPKFRCFRKNLYASKIFTSCQLCCEAYPKAKNSEK
jgi:MoaA/NifB/PqqE/SkfB family radical SAM enzyme